MSAAIPEVSRPSPSRRQAEIRAHHSRLPADELGCVDDIPVTSVSRTLLDLAGVLTRQQLERSLNEAEVLGLTDVLSVPDLLERYQRRRGSAVLRDLFRDRRAARGITRRELERRFQAALTGTDIPLPRLNAPIFVQGDSLRPTAFGLSSD